MESKHKQLYSKGRNIIENVIIWSQQFGYDSQSMLTIQSKKVNNTKINTSYMSSNS